MYIEAETLPFCCYLAVIIANSYEWDHRVVAVYRSERHSCLSQCDSLNVLPECTYSMHVKWIHHLPSFPEHTTHFFLGNAKQYFLLGLMVQLGIDITFKANEIPTFAAVGQKETKLSCLLHECFTSTQ
jgi:hypothetical protein